MFYGIVNVSSTPLRATNDHKAEMTSQLLFGELIILLSQENNWSFIQCDHDGFEGWINNDHFIPLTKIEFEIYQKRSHTFCFDVLAAAITKQEHIPLLLGASLPHFDGLSFKLQKQKIVFNGQVIRPNRNHPEPAFIKKIGLKYLNAPFLWGGRSPFGIDNTGLVQQIMRLSGIDLPRKLDHQFNRGKTIQLINNTKVGDICFFEKNGEVNHVGVLLNNTEVLHCTDKVKISQVDSHGLLNKVTNNYDYQLRIIKRMF